MSPYSSSLALRDSLKPYLRLLGAWDRRRLYALCRSLLQARSSVLSRAARTRLQRRRRGAVVYLSRVDDWVKIMSSFLEEIPWDAFRTVHWRRLRERHGERSWHLVVHDMSDIAKPFAEKLEGLSTVHDGSTGELVNGYVFCLSIGVGKESWDIHPIWTTLLNPHAKEFTSQNDAFKTQIRQMLNAEIGRDVLHVFDRGFDDEKWLDFGDSEKIAWMIRLKDNRKVTFRGEPDHAITTVAATILSERVLRDGDCTYAKADIGIEVTHDADGKKITPEMRTYALVAVKREKYVRPLLLLLNGRVKDLREAVRLYNDYLDRWEIEDCIRFGKQSLKTEQMQLRTFIRLQRFLQLQLLLWDFLLREYDKGVRPIGASLREILLRSIGGDTHILSPYLLADHIGDSLRADQRQCDPDLVPRLSPQLTLLPVMDTA